MRLDLDSELRFPQRERAGFLRKIVLDDNNNVTEVVVETPRFFSKRVIVPIGLLSEGPGGVTYVNCPPEEFDKLGEFMEEQAPASPDAWDFGTPASAVGEAFPRSTYEPMVPIVEMPNLPEGWTSISQGTEVWCLDDRWGIVDDLLVDEGGKPTGIIGRPDDIEQHKRLIPAQLIRQLEADRVVLSCSLDELDANSEEITEGIGEPEES